MKLLNIACGKRIHKDWINIDFHKSSEGVLAMNVSKDLSFEDNYFNSVYSGHFFEHISKKEAKKLLKEVFRVSRKGAILRIVVPNLEDICREYLNILSNIDKKGFKKKHEWITIELFDQMVRSKGGGEMKNFYVNPKNKKDNKIVDYIKNRVGENINKKTEKKDSLFENFRKLNYAKIKELILYSYIKLIRLLLPKSVKDNLFLNTSVGERHVYMYDRHSLAKLLKKAGFKNIKIMSYNKSSIPNFNNYFLDINEDGTPYKGCSSLYIECEK
jgi:ubiquinone/menaquinone biosynthesis C-methylase UbiE